MPSSCSPHVRTSLPGDPASFEVAPKSFHCLSPRIVRAREAVISATFWPRPGNVCPFWAIFRPSLANCGQHLARFDRHRSKLRRSCRRSAEQLSSSCFGSRIIGPTSVPIRPSLPNFGLFSFLRSATLGHHLPMFFRVGPLRGPHRPIFIRAAQGLAKLCPNRPEHSLTRADFADSGPKCYPHFGSRNTCSTSVRQLFGNFEAISELAGIRLVAMCGGQLVGTSRT